MADPNDNRPIAEQLDPGPYLDEPVHPAPQLVMPPFAHQFVNIPPPYGHRRWAGRPGWMEDDEPETPGVAADRARYWPSSIQGARRPVLAMQEGDLRDQQHPAFAPLIEKLTAVNTTLERLLPELLDRNLESVIDHVYFTFAKLKTNIALDMREVMVFMESELPHAPIQRHAQAYEDSNFRSFQDTEQYITRLAENLEKKILAVNSSLSGPAVEALRAGMTVLSTTMSKHFQDMCDVIFFIEDGEKSKVHDIYTEIETIHDKKNERLLKKVDEQTKKLCKFLDSSLQTILRDLYMAHSERAAHVEQIREQCYSLVEDVVNAQQNSYRKDMVEVYLDRLARGLFRQERIVTVNLQRLKDFNDRSEGRLVSLMDRVFDDNFRKLMQQNVAFFTAEVQDKEQVMGKHFESNRMQVIQKVTDTKAKRIGLLNGMAAAIHR